MGGLRRGNKSSVARMRLLLLLLGFILAACLADDKYQAEDGGGLFLNAEPEPEPEPQLINLRPKRVPKKNDTNSKRGPKKSNANSKKPTRKTRKSLGAKNNKKAEKKQLNRKGVKQGNKKKSLNRGGQKKRKQRNKKANGRQNKKSQASGNKREKSKQKNKERREKVRQKKKDDKKKEKDKEERETERKTFESRQCSTATVSDECLTNALDVMIWERGPVKSFLKKYSRFTKFTEQTGNKNAKKSKFKDVAGYLSEGAGGNLNNITCESNETTSSGRRVSEYQERYNELENCSTTVEEACSNFTIPEEWAELIDCHKNITNSPHFLNSTSKIKDLVQECVTLQSEDANAHCTCWENINNREDVKLFKENKCIKKMDTTMKAMKEFKLGKKGVGGCLNAFKACKTAQKAAPGLVKDCMNFEESHVAEVQVDNSTARLFF